jgi:RNA polymerase sigma factor (sigma-70 family)
VRDDPSVIALVTRAAAGDQHAWDEIVERYVTLVWSVCMRYRLSRDDSDEVNQNVWLQLVKAIGSLREPAALPGWLLKTTHHECLAVLRVAAKHGHAELPPDERLPPALSAGMIDDQLLAAERDAALRAALGELSPRDRELLSLLMCDPPLSYKEISAKMGIAVGSIGSMRKRALEQLGKSRHLKGIAEIQARKDQRDDDKGSERGD